MPQSAAKTIFYSLDGIRGVAALLIVARHTERFFLPWNVQESYLAVDVFFVLSGVVIAQAYGGRVLAGQLSFREFAYIRAVRIMPLYLLGTAISVVAMLTGLVGYGSGGFLALYVLLGAFMLPNPGLGTVDVFPLNNPAWSLPLELAVNAVFVRFIGELTPRRIAVILAVSAAGIAFTLWWAKSHSLNIGFWARSFPFGVFRVGFSFFVGVLLFRSYPRLKRAAQRVPFPTACAWTVLAATAVALMAAPSQAVQPFYDFAMVTCVFPVLVASGLAFQPRGASVKVFRFLGLVSYAVYVLHAPLGGVIDGLLDGRMERGAPWSGVAFVALLVAVCALADAWFDAPVRRWLLRWGNPGRMAARTPVARGGQV